MADEIFALDDSEEKERERERVKFSKSNDI